LPRPALTSALSPDGTRLAVLDQERAIWIVDTQSSAPPRLLPASHYTGVVRRLRFSPSGQALLTIGSNWARAWNVVTGDALTPPLHEGGDLLDAAFAGDDQVVTISTDGRLHAWRLTGLRYAGMTFSVGDRRIQAIVRDGAERQWDETPDERTVEELRALAAELLGKPPDDDSAER
jgi:WD40 repeat protein